jgi:hypothetical protein
MPMDWKEGVTKRKRYLAQEHFQDSKMAVLPRNKEAFILKNIMNEYFPYDEKDEDDVLDVIQTCIDASQKTPNKKAGLIAISRSDKWLYVNVLRLLDRVAPKLNRNWYENTDLSEKEKDLICEIIIEWN